MNFNDETNVQVSLPQFSEITSRSNSGGYISSNADLQAAANAIYTTAAAANQSKHQQLLVSIVNLDFKTNIIKNIFHGILLLFVQMFILIIQS